VAKAGGWGEARPAKPVKSVQWTDLSAERREPKASGRAEPSAEARGEEKAEKARILVYRGVGALRIVLHIDAVQLVWLPSALTIAPTKPHCGSLAFGPYQTCHSSPKLSFLTNLACHSPGVFRGIRRQMFCALLIAEAASLMGAANAPFARTADKNTRATADLITAPFKLVSG